ncbi:MAG: hypothetical protein ACK4MT_07515 [Thermaurantiacus tibetensis]|uniref:hypothetical protein n=1 Tax=Elioraea tepidiphila TaxID=457934 RepID=UPI002FDB1212
MLVDTNAILEAHRTDSWRALRGGHRLETVETCIVETQTGAQNRRPEQCIDEASLRGGLKAIHAVTDAERAEALLRDPFLSRLDDGERDLWSHALTRSDAWVLCGPDTTSLRLGVRLGLGDRLVALEDLLEAVGHRPRSPLRRNYTTAWHRQQLAAMALEEGGRRR